MKKIAFVLRLVQVDKFHGGGEKLFYNLIKKFSEDGYLVDIYCSSSDIEKYPGINKIIVVDEDYHHLKPQVLETFYEKVRELIFKESYDYVVSENITPPLDITYIQGHSMVHRQKSVKHPLEALFYMFRKVKRERIKYQYKWIKEGYRKLFIPSYKVKQDLVENFGVEPEKIVVVYPGVDLDETESIDFDKVQSEFTFGMSAPGFEKKGGYIFLKALKLLKDKKLKFKAKIIYPKYNTNILAKLFVKILGLEKNIEFLGFQKDMKSFYQSVDCIVMPSKEDSFGMVALEGMANGKISIVSSYAGASEIIDDGENGFVFDMSSPEKNLMKKMSFILENKDCMNLIRKKGFETSLIYSWDKVYRDFKNNL